MKKSYDPIPKLQPQRKPPKRGRAMPGVALDDWCRARIPKCCTGRAECRHHRIRRSQGGTDERSNTVDLCHACHQFIHTQPAWSFKHGWLRRAATPEGGAQ